MGAGNPVVHRGSLGGGKTTSARENNFNMEGSGNIHSSVGALAIN